jgi:uncharacterized protein
MPNNATAKTEWVLRRANALAVAVALIILLTTILLWWWLAPPTRTLHAGRLSYRLDLATTSQQQAQGLSGRPSMASNRGMLFIFAHEDQQCFWMKDMRFPLDIIWTNAAHKVVYLEYNLSPATYPQTYCSSDPASYVIELNAGEIEHAGIYKGQLLNF